MAARAEGLAQSPTGPTSACKTWGSVADRAAASKLPVTADRAAPSKLPVARTSTVKPTSAGQHVDRYNGVDAEERIRPTSDERASRFSRRRPTRERSRSNDTEQRRGRGGWERGDHDDRRCKEDRGLGNTRRNSHYGTAGPIGARPSSSDSSWTRGRAMTTNVIGYKHQSPSVDRSWARKGSDHSGSSWGGSWGNSDDSWGSNGGTQKPIVGVAWSGSSGWRDSGAGRERWEKSSWSSHGSGSDWAGREGGWWDGHGGNCGRGQNPSGSYQKGASDGSASWKRKGNDDSGQRRGGSASKSRSPGRPSAAWAPTSSPPSRGGADAPLAGTTSTGKSSAAKPPKALDSACLAGPSKKPGMMPGLQPSQGLAPPSKAATMPTLQTMKAQIRPAAGQTGLATWDSVARVIPLCSVGRQTVISATAKR